LTGLTGLLITYYLLPITSSPCVPAPLREKKQGLFLTGLTGLLITHRLYIMRRKLFSFALDF